LKKMKGKLLTINKIILFCLFAEIPVSSNNPALAPAILSPPATISKAKGETAKFHCLVQHLDGRHIVWRRGFNVLATGHTVIVADSRVSIEKHKGVNTLVIKDISELDAGDYVCQISVPNDILSVEHKLDVLVAPSVKAVREVVVTEGEEVVLECEVTGNPRPSLVWSRPQSQLPPGSETSCPDNSCLTLPSVSRADSGSYLCTADNGVGQPDSASSSVVVQYSPVITVETESIPSGPGSTVVIDCLVAGEPQPSTAWFFEERQLSAGPEVMVKQTRGQHSLTLTDIKNNNFGNYSCVATNRLGSYKKYIEVHGRPTSALFHNERVVPGKTSFELSWEVESFVPIREYRLLYRMIEVVNSAVTRTKVETGSDWTNVIIPGEHKSYNNKQTMRWRLDKLLPETRYECLVQARNRYGWSQASKMFTFQTLSNTYKSAATQGINWTSSRAGSLSHLSLLLLLLLLLLQGRPY